MSYNNVIKGALKFKGGDSGLKEIGKKKKKKKEEAAAALALAEEAANEEGAEEQYQAFNAHKPSRTPAEKSFIIAQTKRRDDKTVKSLTQTHRERMETFNQHLGSLSEHFDIPKVGPG